MSENKNVSKEIKNIPENLKGMPQDIVAMMLAAGHSTKSPLQDSVEEKAEKLVELGNGSEAMKVSLDDAYGNSLTSIGTDDKVQSFTNYGFSNDTLNWPLWLALYNDSWVFRRAIDKPSVDTVRCGITLSLDNAEAKDKIFKDLKKYRSDLINLLQWGALFGGSVAVCMFDNFKDEDYAKPLSVAKLKSAKVMRLYVTDRWYGVGVIGTDTVSNMKSLDFGKPKKYRISFADGKTLEVHHSYILRYEHRTAPKLIKNGQLQGWGYAEGAHILNELSRDDQLKASIQSLLNKALIEVIKMSGMRGVFMGQDTESENQLRQRLEMVNWGRSYNSLTFLDKEDDYQEHGFSGLTGLADLLEQNMWLISAALEMQGVLFGDLKQGFSNDTDALERYDETILNRAENYYRPVLEKLLWILYKRYNIKEPIEFEFNSLLVKKHDDERMEGLSKFQQILSSMLGDGVLTAEKYAEIIQHFVDKNEVSFNFDEAYKQEIKNNIAEEMENIDLEEDDEEENPDEVELKENGFAKPKDSWLKRLFKKKKE